VTRRRTHLQAIFFIGFVFALQVGVAEQNPLNADRDDGARSLQYGVVTLKDVYSNLINLNQALVLYVEQSALKNSSKIIELTPQAYTEKTQIDVYHEMVMLINKVNQLLKMNDVAPIKVSDENHQKVALAKLYVLSGRAIDKLVELMHKKNLRTTYGELYQAHYFLVNKTTNQVFALVALASERLSLVHGITAETNGEKKG
jgi:hypothetical protein